MRARRKASTDNYWNVEDYYLHAYETDRLSPVRPSHERENDRRRESMLSAEKHSMSELVGVHQRIEV